MADRTHVSSVVSAARPSEVLESHRDEILEFLHARGFNNIHVFGSCLTGLDRPGSDVDLFVEGGNGSGFAVVEAALDLSERYGVRFDLRWVSPEQIAGSGLEHAWADRMQL
ncbi:nucleotidyltransferase family protein [Pseudoclavibacter soli]|uniref:nucleotidyltransferase family protein n=1 Tax=Pseudoclavibacter soli TaxID=452623 RepID=UPI00146F8E45|nr:nucleotidyltransferase domain-containing protein [Pseudoclavibacter soli]